MQAQRRMLLAVLATWPAPISPTRTTVSVNGADAHREHDVGLRCSLGGRGALPRAALDERPPCLRRRVVDGQRRAGVEQVPAHRRSHPAAPEQRHAFDLAAQWSDHKLGGPRDAPPRQRRRPPRPPHARRHRGAGDGVRRLRPRRGRQPAALPHLHRPRRRQALPAEDNGRQPAAARRARAADHLGPDARPRARRAPPPREARRGAGRPLRRLCAALRPRDARAARAGPRRLPAARTRRRDERTGGRPARATRRTGGRRGRRRLAGGRADRGAACGARARRRAGVRADAGAARGLLRRARRGADGRRRPPFRRRDHALHRRRDRRFVRARHPVRRRRPCRLRGGARVRHRPRAADRVVHAAGEAVRQSYGSDVMVDAIKACGFEYVALNPGSSYRCLHDSLVNYGGNEPQIITCNHEKLAVAIAHGYAKASGRPMAVILHHLVRLLHGAMGIYYAYIDRAPVVVFGGAGPMAYDRRRPNIDWIHTANVQGNAVRDYTKWDDQPYSVASVPESIARGYRVATAAPQGPVYIALDAGLQEDELEEPVPLPDWERLRTPTPIAPEPAALGRLAELLTAAERPLLVTGYAGRDPAAFGQLVELAETVGAGVVDTGWRLSFPNRHELNVTGSDAVEEADCVLFVDVKDMGKPTQELDRTTRRIASRIAPGATVLDLGFNELGISAWSHDFAQLHETDLQVTADTAVALPLLLDVCRELGAPREAWRARLRELHDEAWRAWRAEAEDNAHLSPVATSRLAAEVWAVPRDYDWVLAVGTASDWAQRTWDFDRPYRHPGRSLGTATQIGISLGVALAHKGSGRLVVDLQPDGDLMFDLGALWIAAYHRIPLP